MSTYHFTIEGNCGGTISSLDCCSYNPYTIRNYDDYVIDLRRLNFINPWGSVGILCLIECLLKYKKPIKVVMPADPKVQDYFNKIHMIDALESITKTEPMPLQFNDTIPRLTPILPVASFYNEREVEEIAQQIETTMHDQGFTNIIWPCYTIITELASNVVQHSEGSRGWVVAQRYEYKSERLIEISVGDSGIGMRRSLRKNPQLTKLIVDDKIALKKAVSERVSRYSDPLRGNGLYQVCSEVLATDRRLSIRSGSGCLVVYHDGRQIVYERPHIAGVLTEGLIPC